MATPFAFLSIVDFQLLGSNERLAYLDDAMKELQRTGKAGQVHGWDTLFTQPQPEDDPRRT
jgi:hypothetical protein